MRTNADSATDVITAKKLGAKGIGLCRTEHMFFNPKRIHEVRKMIIALDNGDLEETGTYVASFKYYPILNSSSTAGETNNPIFDGMKVRVQDVDLELSFKLVKETKLIDTKNDNSNKPLTMTNI